MSDSLGLSFLHSIPSVSLKLTPSLTLDSFGSICSSTSSSTGATTSTTTSAVGGGGFSYLEEEKRARLVSVSEMLVEPLMLTGHFILDFFVDKLVSPSKPPASVVVSGVGGVRVSEQLLPIGNLGNDRQYQARRRVAELNARRDRDLDPSASDAMLPPMCNAVNSLSLSKPWPFYYTPTGAGMSAGSGFVEGEVIRYHRVPLSLGHHLIPFRVASSSSSGSSNSGSGNTGVPKQIEDISLSNTSNPFVLVEYSEENPLFLHTPGLTASISRYYRATHRATQQVAGTAETAPPEANQLAILGPIGTLRKIDSPFIPRVFGGNMVRLDSCVCLLESGLIRVPLFKHKISENDFLAIVSVASSHSSGGGVGSSSSVSRKITLRRIEVSYISGQQEPIAKLEVPNSSKMTQYIKSRVWTECRRVVEQSKQVNLDSIHKLFPGERKNIITRYFQEFLSTGAAASTGPATTAGTAPEEIVQHNIIETQREGIRRLKSRGISRLINMNVQRVTQYITEIEAQQTETLRPLYYACLELLKELQLTPWNLIGDYWEVVHGKKGATFAFSAIGDPSGGRGEGVSYVRSSGVGGVGEARGLGGDLRTKTKQELIDELKKAGVAERLINPMSRWDMLRHLAGVKGSTATVGAGGEKVPVHQRKHVQMERLNLAWRKQFHALATVSPPPAGSGSAGASAATVPGAGFVAGATGGSGAAPAAPSSDDGLLEDLLLADLQGSSSPVEATKRGSAAPSDKAELAAFREAMRGPTGPAPSGGEGAGGGIRRLKVVQTGVEGQNKTPYTKITYIYGERNIEVYRRWRKLHFADVSEVGGGSLRGGDGSVRGGPGGRTRTWHEMVEEALRVHRRLAGDLAEGRLSKADARARRCRSCHWLGHDASFPGCPNSADLGEEEDLEEVIEDPVVGEEGDMWRDIKRPRVGEDDE